MIGKVNRYAKVAASASLAIGAIVATAGPAAAASPNSGSGVDAAGLISAGPLAQSTFPGTSPNSLATVNVAGLITTGLVNTTADATSASAQVANPAVTLSAVASLSAGAVSSSCSFDTNGGGVTGTSSIVGGNFTVLGIPTALAANAAPNTVVGIPGVATVTLNKQTTAADGTLTVNAIDVALIGSTQTLDIATSVCNAASLAPVPVLPGMALPIGLGALGVFGLGGLGFVMARRRRTATAA
jgi:hypothetical protein